MYDEMNRIMNTIAYTTFMRLSIYLPCIRAAALSMIVPKR